LEGRRPSGAEKLGSGEEGLDPDQDAEEKSGLFTVTKSFDPASGEWIAQIRLSGEGAGSPGQGMLAREEDLMAALNGAGRWLTGKMLSSYDRREDKIKVNEAVLYKCGRTSQTYCTPFGPIRLPRSVYQSSDGGRLYCPLESEACLVLNSTPRYAKTVSHKMACLSAPSVRSDLLANHGVSISHDYAKDLADAVAWSAQAKERVWKYADFASALPEVAYVTVSLDGTRMYLKDEGGWREAMVGVLAYYGKDKKHIASTFIGAEPERGKEDFLAHLEFELGEAKRKHPEAMTVGLADGARLNWAWLTERTDLQMLDFYHLSEYVKLAASALFPERKGASLETRKSNAAEKAGWVTDRLHSLKHRKTAPAAVIKELGAAIDSLRLELEGASKRGRKEDGERLGALEKARTYMANQKSRMNYHYAVKRDIPIGSGCAEGGCKLIIKDRLCRTGMRWTKEGAASVIALRCLVKTEGRWEAFWEMLMGEDTRRVAA
jgi:hypothetical protein